MNIVRLIKLNNLFCDLEDKEINALFDVLKSRIVRYPKGKIILQEGTRIDSIGILLNGLLLKYVTKEDGNRVAQGTIEQGGMFGEVDGFSKDGTASFSIVAADESAILYITLESLIADGGRMSSGLMTNLIRYYVGRITAINKDTEYLIIKSMRLKISKLIYDKYIEQGTLSIELGLNRNEMAEYLNVSRPSMSREMMRMRDEGIITFWKDKINITNLSALEKILKIQ
jgi:CRP-like cAMP-binding protein